MEWFREIFIPHATGRKQSGKRILLTFDGHHSHETPELLAAAFEHNIILYCLPSKTTHKLQSLDVGVFGPLQTALARHTQQRASENHTITRDTIIHEYMTIRAKYMTERTIISAFHRSGMWPINPGIFDAQDFAPSLHSSTQNSAPSSYPPYIASSPFSCRTTDATDPDWVVTESNTSSSASSDISESTTLVSSLFSLTSLN